MLTVNCICVGKLKERYWTQACEEYQKRLGAFCKFRIIEVAEHKLPEQPSETQIQQALKAEGEKILQLAASIGKGNALRANLSCVSDTKSWSLP